MSDWKGVRNAVTDSKSADYAHTPRKNSEQESPVSRLSSPDEILEYIKTDIRFAKTLRLIQAGSPLARMRFRYKRTDGHQRYVPALDIALLIWAGFSESELAEYLNCLTHSVRRMVTKLRKAGAEITVQRPVAPPSSPEGASPPVESDEQEDGRLRLIDVILRHKLGEFSVEQVQVWLDKQAAYWDRQWEKKHVRSRGQ